MKKLLSLVTVFMLVFMTSAVALAGGNDSNLKGLKKNAEIVKAIAAGEDLSLIHIWAPLLPGWPGEPGVFSFTQEA